MAVMTAPKPSFGGQRTHRAAQSKAFDFELPFLDTTTNILTPYVPVKEAPIMGSIEESGYVYVSCFLFLFSFLNGFRRTVPFLSFILFHFFL